MELLWTLFFLCGVALIVLGVFWIGEAYGHQHPRVPIPPRPTRCPWCGGQLRSVLVWSSVCRVCNRGQVGPFAADTRAGSKEAKAAPFVSHVDADRGPSS